MVKFVSLFSGSSRNASVFRYKNTNVLIDCGGSMKQIKEGLDEIGINTDDINALFITHSHIDHINALSMLIKYTDIPVYASYGTHEEIFDKGINMAKDRRVIIPEMQGFSVGDIDVCSFKTPHDTNGSMGFNFFFGNKSASYATDIGCIEDGFKEKIMGKDFLFFESNHDITMLKNCYRPEHIKQRILGNKGHLSNEVSADFSVNLAKDGLKRLMLGHLSGEANTPELAYRVTDLKMKEQGIKTGKDLLLWVASRDKRSELIEF